MPVVKFEQSEKISNILDVEIIEYGLFCGDDWKYSDLKAPFSRIYLLLDGEAVVLTQQDKIVIKKGNAYLIPSNMNFSCYTPKHMKKLYVHFSCKQWGHTNFFDQVQQVLTCPIDTSVYESFAQILAEENHSALWQVKGSMLQFIYQFISNLDSGFFDKLNDQQSPELIACFNLLKQGISAKTRTSDIADQMKMSQSMLSKMYKAATGMSLKHYIQLQLIEQAQTLLSATNMSVKEVASSLQYEDALYFTRVFHQWVGESPSKYRERNRI